MGYKSPRTYTICAVYGTSFNPVDATLYYMGGANGGGFATSGTGSQFVIPISGFIRSVSVQIYSITANGTNEDWTLSLYDGTTTTAIATTGVSAAKRTWINNNMQYPVTSGGYVQVITTTPTWVTNPEGCRVVITLVVEYE